MSFLNRLVHFMNGMEQLPTGIQTGKLNKIDLTFGGAGNQNMTIDGEVYATWIGYEKWPKVGETVRHMPYYHRHGDRWLKSTRILDLNNQEL